MAHAGVCRHVLVMAACNMIETGERNGYAAIVKLLRLYPMTPKFIYQDIACKHEPWESRATAAVRDSPALQGSRLQQLVQATAAQQQDVQHVLPDAHGRAHVWHCQVSALYSIPYWLASQSCTHSLLWLMLSACEAFSWQLVWSVSRCCMALDTVKMLVWEQESMQSCSSRT